LTSQQGDLAAGIEQMRKAVDDPSSAVMRPMLLTYIAEQQLRAEHFADSIGTLNQAAEEVRTGASRFYEPEIVRLGGEILLAQSAANAAQAESVFRQAMALATEQSCRMLELRSAISLARLLGSDGRKSEAHDLLAPMYGAFTEGFGRADLQTAKNLLAGLS
jgi:predicted ATPase